MKHLILGKGNMGVRHGEILNKLGDTTEYHDPVLGIYAKGDYGSYDSILICTPPEAHRKALEAIYDVTGGLVPVFVEKPVIDDSRPLQCHFKTSLVACNWRFHPYTKRMPWTIVSRYPSATKLDLIHFYDVLWERYGEQPKYSDNSVYIKDSRGIVLAGTPGLYFNSNEVSPGNMFHDQMIHWRNVVEGKEKSVNPIELALERTQCLIKSIQTGN